MSIFSFRVMMTLPPDRKTSNWSTQMSLSSSTGLSFFTKATTYLASAAGSASQLKQSRGNTLISWYQIYLQFKLKETSL